NKADPFCNFFLDPFRKHVQVRSKPIHAATSRRSFFSLQRTRNKNKAPQPLLQGTSIKRLPVLPVPHRPDTIFSPFPFRKGPPVRTRRGPASSRRKRNSCVRRAPTR